MKAIRFPCENEKYSNSKSKYLSKPLQLCIVFYFIEIIYLGGEPLNSQYYFHGKDILIVVAIWKMVAAFTCIFI